MALRAKRCVVCGGAFRPAFSTMQVACSPDCAHAYAVWKRQQAERQADRARLQELDPRRYRLLLAKAQRAFNSYVRARDADMPCISCGRAYAGHSGALRGHGWDAGHYLSIGARPELRFDEANVHRQCVACNRRKAGNAAAYRVRLIKRIGLAEVERLEGPHPPRKWTREQLEELRRTYAAKAAALTKETGP